MNRPDKKRLYLKCAQKQLSLNFVAEVGVYLPETSNVLDFILDGLPAMLVEADPNMANKIREYFSEYPKVSVHEVAVFDKAGTVTLSQRDASTFVSELDSSPAIVNDSYTPDSVDEFVAKAVTFDEIDKGQIDLLSIDIEGGEWFVIKHMVSRPDVLSIETHGKYYTNPYLSEILAWTAKQGYKVWFKDDSDTVFVKEKLVKLEAGEKISLFLKNLHINLRKAKGKLLGKI